MIRHEVAQGSPEWFQARAGVVTASNFALARARLKSGPNKGEFTSAAHDYAFRLAIERIAGKPLDDEQFMPWQAKRGHELEPEARRVHEARTGLLVEPVGFISTDDGFFGASADGLIDDWGGAEYKCFLSPEKLRNIIMSSDLSDVMDQIQGGMWITGRKVWHFALYCPALLPIGRHLTLQVVERDDEFIGKMETELRAFNDLVREYQDRLHANEMKG